jgi:hypothetical protein
MSRDEVEQELASADADSRVCKELRVVVQEINNHVPGVQTKAMMYDLVHVVLEMDERIRQLEYRVSGTTPREELGRREMTQARKDAYFNQSD